MCPLCGSSSGRLGTRARSLDLEECTRCGLVFHTGFSSAAELTAYYSHYYSADNLAFSPTNDARFNDLLTSFETYRQTGRVLDVGCGAGQFLKVALSRGWDAHGTEIASGALEHLSRLGIKHFAGELQAARYPAGSFDVVYCSEVIEHAPNPGGLLGEICRIVRQDGLVYLTTPNYNSLTRRLAGSSWRIFSTEHICYFTPTTLVGAMRGIGFTTVQSTTRNLDLNELRRVFRRGRSSPATSFQHAPTEQLREALDRSRVLSLGKRGLNWLLALTSSGDTIVVRARK